MRAEHDGARRILLLIYAIHCASYYKVEWRNMSRMAAHRKIGAGLKKIDA